jgi:hypothetical protein
MFGLFGWLAWISCCEGDFLRQPSPFFNCSNLKGVCAELLSGSHIARRLIPLSVHFLVFLTRSACLWRIIQSFHSLVLTRSTCLVWCVQGWTGSPHWRTNSVSPLLLFNEIYMFGLVCTGLDELLDGVA